MAGSAGGSAAAVFTAEGPSRGGGLVTTSEAGLAVVGGLVTEASV